MPIKVFDYFISVYLRKKFIFLFTSNCTRSVLKLYLILAGKLNNSFDALF